MAQASAAGPQREQHAVVEMRTTFSRREDALACAERLVQGRLAACVQVDGPVTSVYRWQGEVESATETPELIVTETGAAAAYAAWVRACVESEPRGGE